MILVALAPQAAHGRARGPAIYRALLIPDVLAAAACVPLLLQWLSPRAALPPNDARAPACCAGRDTVSCRTVICGAGGANRSNAGAVALL